mgnify:CR=1 FL=1
MDEQIQYWTDIKNEYTHNLKNNFGHKPSIDALLIKINTKLDKLIKLQTK